MALLGGYCNMTYSPFSFNQQGTGTSVGIVSSYTNSSSVNPIPQGTPCSLTGTADQIAPTDATNQTSVASFVGLAQFRIPASGNGPVISNGRLLNLASSWGFSVGNSIWIGLGGIIQSTRPDTGITGFGSGDFIYFIGNIVQNESNSLQQDLVVIPQLIGEL
jgi:hypothetical protein